MLQVCNVDVKKKTERGYLSLDVTSEFIALLPVIVSSEREGIKRT